MTGGSDTHNLYNNPPHPRASSLAERVVSLVPSNPPSAPVRKAPLYRQVAERLADRIYDGVWASGSAMPTEIAFADEFATDTEARMAELWESIPAGITLRLAPIETRVSADGDAWRVSVWFVEAITVGTDAVVDDLAALKKEFLKGGDLDGKTISGILGSMATNTRAVSDKAPGLNTLADVLEAGSKKLGGM